MSALILIGVDVEEVKKILYKLEPKEQNKALKKALKETAKQARERLGDKARDSYTIKKAGFKREMKIKSTSSGKKPASIIKAEGEPIPLKEFKTRRGKVTKAQVVKPGKLKPLVSKRGGINAFVNNIAKRGQTRSRDTSKGAAGSAVRHLAVAQRRGKKRLEINEKYSNSIPAMIGSQKHVYGVIRPYIAEDLHANLERFVKQALGG